MGGIHSEDRTYSQLLMSWYVIDEVLKPGNEFGIMIWDGEGAAVESSKKSSRDQCGLAPLVVERDDAFTKKSIWN